MSDFIPNNDLDRAIEGSRRKSGLPELYRQLGEGELWALLPYHPEVEGEMFELKNGMQNPFALLQEQEGLAVPIFSSEERADEGMKTGKVPPRTYSVGALPAKVLLQALGSMELHAVLNKGCATGQVILPPNLMRDVADGSVFQPATEGPLEKAKSKILDPADYPTDLVQALFEVLRQHANFRAAWIFSSMTGERGQPEGRCYNVPVLMEPRDQAIFHDLNLVAQAACGNGDGVDLGMIDETDHAHLEMLFARRRRFTSRRTINGQPEAGSEFAFPFLPRA
jgi:hypothetical protein